MAMRKTRTLPEVYALLEELFVDVYGDDEQLTAFCESIVEAFNLPIDVPVVGEPVSLIAVDYDGNPVVTSLHAAVAKMEVSTGSPSPRSSSRRTSLATPTSQRTADGA